MIYGYINIRKDAINPKKILKNYTGTLRKWGAEKIVVETDGNMLQDLLDCLVPGDSIHVISLTHLTRSLARLFELSHYFQKNNISIYEINQQVNWDMFMVVNEIAARTHMCFDEE